MRTLIQLTSKLMPGPLRRLFLQTCRESSQPRQSRREPPAQPANRNAERAITPQIYAPSSIPRPTTGSAGSSPESDEQLDTQTFAKRLCISGQSVRNWRRDGKIHGVRSGRSYVFPASQIMAATNKGSAQLVPALKDIFKRFSSTDEAWSWLTIDMIALRTDSKSSDTPIQALRQGRRQAVTQIL